MLFRLIFRVVPKARTLAVALVGAASMGLSDPSLANSTVLAVRCDGAQSEASFKACVLGVTTGGVSPEGMYCGLNVVDDSARCFHLLYEPEMRRYYALPTPAPDGLASRLSLLSTSYREDPTGFSQPKTYYADQSVLPSGPHDPVRVSVGGWRSSERGGMNRAVNECMSALACIRNVNRALANRLEGAYELTGLGIQAGPAGLTVNWNYFAAELNLPSDVWFCKDGNCAKYKFENGGWEFKETRAGQGEGPAYGNPDREQSADWDNIDGGVIAEGMRGSGYSVPGWQYNLKLRCGWVNGVLDHCRWVPYY